MTHQSPSGTAVVRRPSAGGGAAKLAVPSGSLNAMAATGAPWSARNGAMKRWICSGVPAW